MINLKKSFNDALEFCNNKVCILRVDLNMPIYDSEVTDHTRLDKVIPTIKKIIERNGKLILISHLGRPEGINHKDLSLKQIIPIMESKLDQKIKFSSDDVFGRKIDKTIKTLKTKEILLLENIRFYHHEEENDLTFSKRLASFGDIFINESFSTSHRKHASIFGLGNFLPCFPGQLFEYEVKNLSKIFRDLNKKSIAILGGSKVSTKIGLIENLCNKFDKILIGGAMANTFLAGSGHQIGDSLNEKNMEKEAQNLLKKFNNKIIIPEDVIVSNSVDESYPKTLDVKSVPNNEKIYDIGPKTRKLFFNEISKSEILLWNGPLGFFEKRPFDNGTNHVASAVKSMSSKRFFSVAGGGDTISALKNSEFIDYFSFISTGGGSFLELLKGKNLPGIEILNN